MANIVERLEREDARQADVDLLLNVARQIQNKNLCPLGEFSTMAVVTGIERFPQDFKKATDTRIEHFPDGLKKSHES
jgi:NADH:ubiquinone oxidoreductase subunit F (NADH-binding)